MNEKYLNDSAYDRPESDVRPAHYDEQDVFGHEEHHDVCAAMNKAPLF